jgi:acetyltransferase-like isoleucine patch superfamily enzyme
MFNFIINIKLIKTIIYIYDIVLCKFFPKFYLNNLGIKLGKNVRFYGINPGMFSTEPWLISIGNNVYITNGCQFITHDGGTLILRDEVPDLELTAPISIGSNVYIGLNVTIMPGVKIGNRVIIGAGSIVAKDIPDNSVAVGVPARVIKSVDEYLEKAKERSLKLGHLTGKVKEVALKKHFNVVVK